MKRTARPKLKWIRQAFLWIAIALLAAMAAGFTCIVLFRYPNEDEVWQHLNLSSMDEIDGKQVDIGLYHIIEAKKGPDQEYWLETSPQWMFPWEKYEWPVWPGE